MIKCPKCGGDVRIMGQATLSCPGSMYSNFTKRNLRQKDVYLMGVNWETFDIICQNEKCKKVTSNYGNYVSRLEKENKQLKKEAYRRMKQALLDIKNHQGKVCDNYEICNHIACGSSYHSWTIAKTALETVMELEKEK